MHFDIRILLHVCTNPVSEPFLLPHRPRPAYPSQTCQFWPINVKAHSKHNCKSTNYICRCGYTSGLYGSRATTRAPPPPVPEALSLGCVIYEILTPRTAIYIYICGRPDQRNTDVDNAALASSIPMVVGMRRTRQFHPQMSSPYALRFCEGRARPTSQWPGPLN